MLYYFISLYASFLVLLSFCSILDCVFYVIYYQEHDFVSLNTLIAYQDVNPVSKALVTCQLNCRFCLVDTAKLATPVEYKSQTNKNGKVRMVPVLHKLVGKAKLGSAFCVQCFFLRDFPVCRACCADCMTKTHEEVVKIEMANAAEDPTRKAYWDAKEEL
jgi:hypothetical protein